MPAHRRFERGPVGQRVASPAGGRAQLAIEIDEPGSGDMPTAVIIDPRRPAEHPADIEHNRRIVASET